jgi:Mg2+ and Co2+ transporter CorA
MPVTPVTGRFDVDTKALPFIETEFGWLDILGLSGLAADAVFWLLKRRNVIG